MSQSPSLTFVSSPAPGSASRAHAVLLRHGEVQFDFKVFKPPPLPPWLEWIAEHILRPLAWLLAQPLARYALWAVLIVAIGLGIFFVARWIVRRAWAARTGEVATSNPAQSWSLSPARVQLLLADADALAAQGRFDEAIHHLLLRSVGDISEYRPELLKPALTSREIGALPGLPDAARQAFGEITRLVEHALFAGRSVGANDYAACRNEYERLALPDVWHLKRAA